MFYVLLANLPQGLLSISYLVYNSLFTCMLMEQEWQNFAHQRKPLRVSTPTKHQRSSYYLQLPYWFAIPLILFSGLMHWLISQLIFLAHVLAYDASGARDPSNDLITCGYSPIAIIFAIAIGGSTVLVVFVVGSRRYESLMPLARNCSAVISAACHLLPEDVHAATLPVMWGIIYENAGVGHCAFSSREVVRPLDDQRLV